MTVLQKEIKELGNAINNLGYMWFNGFCDNTTEDEKPLQDAMALLIRINDDRREQQEIAFQQMPWLRKHAGQQEEHTMKERKYRLLYDDGHDFGECEFWSSYRAGSKKNREDAEKFLQDKFGWNRFKNIDIIQIYLV